MKKTTFLILFFLLFAGSGLLHAQSADPLKTEALKQMQSGRYGEAIDLLKKYCSSYPQRADGYHLLGQCYEKRDQLEYGVYFYRLATKIEPNNAKISADLAHATKVWYDQIYNKIKGHQREIAVNPRIAVNYLEIGKCYKNLGDWNNAEVWYDKYLALEEPSADEVIRYTEINTMTRNIVKGEIILKRFVEKLPTDQRLWSRYGYFTYWLGKTAIAKYAFEKALALRPYFKEAQDGLDLVLGKGYDYTYHDTTAMRDAQKQAQPQVQEEYAIDKYYRILKVQPENHDIRFLLINELVKVERFEEAYIEAGILKKAQADNVKAQDIFTTLSTRRDSLNKKLIDEGLAKLNDNPNDKTLLLKVAKYYENLGKYDPAFQLLKNYFQTNTADDDPVLRFEYAELALQLQDYYTAVDQLEICLKKDPTNLDYKLKRGLVALWMGQENEIEMAHSYLKEVIAKHPDKIDALVGLAALETHKQNFTEAKAHIEKVKKLNPNHPEIQGLESNLTLMTLRAEEEALFASLDKGRKLYKEGDCPGAVAVYQEFFQKHKGNPTIKKEFGYLNFCAKNYDVAITTFTEVLDVNYDYTVDLDRAKAYFAKADYEKATTEFQRLIASNNADFAANLYLGDCYAQLKRFDEASDVYDRLRDSTKDSTQISLIEQRIGWLPVTGIATWFQYFPTYFLVSPAAFYFADNLDFSYYNASFSAELGITDYLSVGATAASGRLQSAYVVNDFNQFRGNVYIRPWKNVLFGASVGSQNFIAPAYSELFIEAFGRVEKQNVYRLQLSYLNQDAAQILYSPKLVASDYTNNTASRWLAQLYKIDGYYLMKSGFRTSMSYSHIRVYDGNVGNIYELRVGKVYPFHLNAGYEYNRIVFGRVSQKYFSPLSYDSHSIYADWKFYTNPVWEISAGGKVGLIPKNNYWLREIFVHLLIKPMETLSIQIRMGASNTVKDIVGYSSRSISASAFLTI